MSNPAGSAIWERLETLLLAFDYTALALAVVDLAAGERTVVATQLRRYVRQPTDGTYRWFDESSGGLAIIGAGVLPDATAMTAWLTRYSMSYNADPWTPRNRGGQRQASSAVPQVQFVLTSRGPELLPGVVSGLAQRLPRGGGECVDLIERLRPTTGQPPPPTDGFVRGWLGRQLTPGQDAAALTADPRLAALLPRAFEFDEVGAGIDQVPRRGAALVELVAHPAVDRGAVLDACLARLGRGGKPGATRAFLAVHDGLAPTMDEVEQRIDGYLAVLPSAPSTVVTAAQRELFRLDDAGRLPIAALVEATRAVLARPEKKLVRAQLARATSAAAMGQAQATDLARVIVASMPASAPDLVRLGIRSVHNMAPALGASTRDELLAVDGLATDLLTDLAEALGATAARSAGPAPVADPAVTGPRPRIALRAIETPDELAGEISVLFEHWCFAMAPEPLERVLDGLVRWSTDHAALRAALSSTLESSPYTSAHEEQEYGYNVTNYHALAALISAAVGDPAPPRFADRDHFARRGPAHALNRRIFALADALRATPVPELHAAPGPGLVSFPTWTNGMLALSELLQRLDQATRSGREPWAVDLDQALLRLVGIDDPDDPDVRDTVTALVALGTPAARRAADWIEADWIEADWIEADWIEAGTPARATVEAHVVDRYRHAYRDDHTYGPVREGEQIIVTIRASDGPATNRVWDDLSTLPAEDQYGLSEEYTSPRCWPALLPTQRDVLAGWLVRPLIAAMDLNRMIGDVLPMLAECEGPVGPGLNHALAYGLSTKRDVQRAPAVRALDLFCGQPGFDPAEFGGVLGELIVLRTIVAKRIVEPLREVATPHGASVWSMLAVIVERLLAADPAVPGSADVIGLAAEVAERVQPGTVVPGLRELAGRKGQSRQLVEARRLYALLTASPQRP